MPSTCCCLLGRRMDGFEEKEEEERGNVVFFPPTFLSPQHNDFFPVFCGENDLFPLILPACHVPGRSPFLPLPPPLPGHPSPSFPFFPRCPSRRRKMTTEIFLSFLPSFVSRFRLLGDFLPPSDLFRVTPAAGAKMSRVREK